MTFKLNKYLISARCFKSKIDMQNYYFLFKIDMKTYHLLSCSCLMNDHLRGKTNEDTK